jgi:hypothetical protein
MTTIISPITLLIGIIFCAAALSLFLIWLDFHQQFKQLTILKILLDDLAHNIQDSINISLILSRLQINTLVHERVNLVSKLLKKRIMPNLLEISELTIAKKEAELANQLVNFAIAVLLIIGLGGTFWAFKDVLTNSGLNHVASAGKLDPNKYQQAIDTIYIGFQNAFWASLLGIISTVTLLFGKFIIVNPLREKFFTTIDWITQNDLVPLLAKPDKLEEIEQILTTTTTNFATAVTNMQAVADEMKENVNSAHYAAKELREFATETRQTTELFGQLTQEQSPFYQTVGQLTAIINQVTNRYENLTTAIDELLAQNRQVIEANRQHHLQYTAQVEQTQLAFNQSYQQVTDYLLKLQTAFESQRQQHEQYLYQFNSQYAKLFAQQTDASQQVADYWHKLNAAFEAQRQQYEQYLYQVNSQYAKLFTQQADDANRQLNEFSTQLSQQGQQFGKNIGQVVDNLTPLSIRLQSLITALTAQQEMYSSQLTRALNQLDQMDVVKKIENSVQKLPNYSIQMDQLVKLMSDQYNALQAIHLDQLNAVNKIKRLVDEWTTPSFY